MACRSSSSLRIVIVGRHAIACFSDQFQALMEVKDSAYQTTHIVVIVLSRRTIFI
jgi:hypothetical protein